LKKERLSARRKLLNFRWSWRRLKSAHNFPTNVLINY
jgi:hypothetical protein